MILFAVVGVVGILLSLVILSEVVWVVMRDRHDRRQAE